MRETEFCACPSSLTLNLRGIVDKRAIHTGTDINNRIRGGLDKLTPPVAADASTTSSDFVEECLYCVVLAALSELEAN